MPGDLHSLAAALDFPGAMRLSALSGRRFLCILSLCCYCPVGRLLHHSGCCPKTMTLLFDSDPSCSQEGKSEEEISEMLKPQRLERR